MIKQRRVGVAEAQQGLEVLDSIPLQYVNVDMATIGDLQRLKQFHGAAFRYPALKYFSIC